MYDTFNIKRSTLAIADNVERLLSEHFCEIDKIKSDNTLKILDAMQQNRLSDRHFQWHTGYGYNDEGREITEAIYARVFKGQEALVRTQIVNGTHALSLGLYALLKAGDHLLTITGAPYDTLHHTIGISGQNGLSLKELGVDYQAIDLDQHGKIMLKTVLKSIKTNTKVIYIQRSSGYSFRPSLSIADIEQAISAIKAQYPNIIVMVDNCYGEFIERREPLEVGADLIAGSLIKNPGGGLALSGGYLVGNSDLIARCAQRLTAPGIGKECGLTFGQTRTILQGLFLAPEVVSGALKGAIFAAKLFEDAGYQVKPNWQEQRSDIIQAILLKDRQKVIDFCQAIQRAAPVDAHVVPYPWDMPGYDDPVIMAAGAFIQGSSIELSADAPMREPYAVYLQGGLTYTHSKLGAMLAYQAVVDQS